MGNIKRKGTGTGTYNIKETDKLKGTGTDTINRTGTGTGSASAKKELYTALFTIHMQSLAVSPIQYLLRQKISIVDTFVFVFVSIIKITKVFVIVSISHK